MKSKRCGCFYCLKVFDSSEIGNSDWSKDKNCRTALCPFCGTDAVLGDHDVEISFEMLYAMHKSWF